MSRPVHPASHLADAILGAPGTDGIAWRATGGWIELETDIPKQVRDPWLLLGRNAGLGAGVKIVLGAGTAPCLRAELPMGDPETTRGRLTVLRALLAMAAGRSTRPPDVAAHPAEAVELARVCADAAWPWSERSPGRWAVALETPRDHREATLDLMGEPPRPCVQMRLEAAPAGRLARVALATWLLRATAGVRLVRAARRASALVLEVVPVGVPSRDELDHACAALSVAARTIGREAELIAGDDQLAWEYLRVRDDRLSDLLGEPIDRLRAGAREIGHE